MSEMNEAVIEQATMEDLPQMVDLLYELFGQEGDFVPDRMKQERGLRLILEQPSRGRIFVYRWNDAIVGMVNLLFTISTAEGGFVVLLEDVIVRVTTAGAGSDISSSLTPSSMRRRRNSCASRCSRIASTKRASRSLQRWDSSRAR